VASAARRWGFWGTALQFNSTALRIALIALFIVLTIEQFKDWWKHLPSGWVPSAAAVSMAVLQRAIKLIGAIMIVLRYCYWQYTAATETSGRNRSGDTTRWLRTWFSKTTIFQLLIAVDGAWQPLPLESFRLFFFERHTEHPLIKHLGALSTRRCYWRAGYVFFYNAGRHGLYQVIGLDALIPGALVVLFHLWRRKR